MTQEKMTNINTDKPDRLHFLYIKHYLIRCRYAAAIAKGFGISLFLDKVYMSNELLILT